MLAVPFLAGCKGDADSNAAGSADSSRSLRIAVIPKGTTHEFWKAIHAGAVKAEMELDNVQILWKGPVKESDREQQMNIVNHFVIQHVDGIALAPLDDKSLVGPVLDAGKAGIPVVIMDSGLQAEAGKDYASFVATDNYVGGQKGGRHLGHLLEGKGKVLMLRYMVGSASTEQREKGFLDVMTQEFPEIELVSTDQYGDATSETAQRAADSLLQIHPGLDGVFCPNESTTFGMLLSLRQTGRAGSIKFVGFDSSPKLIQGMKENQLHGLVLQDPFNMGYLAVKTVVAKLRGEEVKPLIDTGSQVATPENMNDAEIQSLLSPPIDQYL